MTSPPAPQTIDRTAPRALWLAARAFLNVLHNLFGAPEAVAAAHVLTRPAHDLLRTWLRAGEAMLRHLLLIEASAFPKPNTPPLLRASRQRERKRLSFSPETPERWRVSFRCFHAPPRRTQSAKPCAAPPAIANTSPRPFIARDARPLRPRPNRAARRSTRARTRARPVLRQDREWVQHQAPLRFRSAWPLAERYEALLRVFNDPAPYARRLARRLHATPHRARELMQAPPGARELIGADFADITALAEQRRCQAFDSA